MPANHRFYDGPPVQGRLEYPRGIKRFEIYEGVNGRFYKVIGYKGGALKVREVKRVKEGGPYVFVSETIKLDPKVLKT